MQPEGLLERRVVKEIYATVIHYNHSLRSLGVRFVPELSRRLEKMSER